MAAKDDEDKTRAAAPSSGKLDRGKRRKRKKQKCFNWISFVTCMVTMEALAMIALLFRSHSITIVPSLEEDAMGFLVWLDTTLGGGGSSEQERDELAELEAHMVQLTEDRLDHGYALEHELETTAIDNYYSRSSHHNHDNNSHNLMTVLLVGGMKGSGTRAVVDALVQLGIPMITLERSTSTKDSDRQALHTGQLAWRSMINIVMSSSKGIRTPNYEFADLPDMTQLRLRQEWEKFFQGFIAKFLPQQPNNGNNILFGFQAHDCLFMLPVFQEFMSTSSASLKAIQVIRDGRDISLLSSKLEIGFDKKEHPLQSMAERFVLETYYDRSNVTKSYDDTAQFDREMQRMVETMELWSDWNLGSQVWFQNHYHADPKQQTTSTSSKGHLDYLQLRTEDLLNPEKKFDALYQLAHFTGLSEKIPFDRLCCMSRQALVVEKPSAEYLQGFSKARAQNDLLQKYSAKLSFLQSQKEEDERRKARLGDLFVDNKLGRRHQPAITKDPDVHKEVHKQRQNRFQDIGDRLAARLSDGKPGAEEGQQRRRLVEGSEKSNIENEYIKEEGKSQEMSMFFDLYFAWRKSLAGARTNGTAATLSIEKGEKLLEEYRSHHDHLKGVLTEDSFTRSIKWLKSLHSSPAPNSENEGLQAHVLHPHGKWSHALKDLPLLSERLRFVGTQTLRAFGYEPRARFMDFDPENQKAKCNIEVTCD